MRDDGVMTDSVYHMRGGADRDSVDLSRSTENKGAQVIETQGIADPNPPSAATFPPPSPPASGESDSGGD